MPDGGERVEFMVDGKVLSSRRGDTLAAAMLNAGVGTFRTSVSSESRAPLCGMGICFECRVRVDGVVRRACMIAVEHGMKVTTDA